jgi:hypothetical protein
MAGMLTRILPKRVYDFAALQVGTSQQIVVADRIDISQHIDAVLAVRVNGGAAGGANTVTLNLYGCGYTANDPALDFRTASPFFAFPGGLGFFPAVAPKLVTYGGTVRGHFASLVLTATRGAVGAFNITMSADLILRSPEPPI